MEGINIMRVLNVTDNIKLFQGLETLISGYKILEELDKYLKNCSPVNNDKINNMLPVNNDAPAEYDDGEDLENPHEDSFNDIFQPTHESKPILSIDLHDMNDIKSEKRDTDGDYEPSVKRQRIRKKKYINERVSSVETMYEWQELNERAMDQDPCLIQHVQSYSNPGKWIFDILKDELLVEFGEDLMEMLSSSIFTMLFDHWNRKFLESLNDPQFCCRNALNQVMKKNHRRFG